ncbi:hypothetical protein ScPMuIL_006911 [Solemya velum]
MSDSGISDFKYHSAYRTDEGKPWVLPVVQTVEAQMADDPTLNHEYLPVAGLEDFREASVKLLLGEDSRALVDNRVLGIQSVGGSGAIRLCADFMKKIFSYNTVYVSNPTWGNHKGIFEASGFTDIREYKYWCPKTKGIDMDGMLSDLRGAPPKSVVILHACAHNPTGVDPTMDQWKQIANVCKEKNIFILMDIAYQGLSTGDLEKDASAVRYLVDNGFEFFASQSFSKNFGLYNERIGNLCCICKDTDAKMKVKSQMEIIVRRIWSNPSNHGARIVSSVLNNSNLIVEWKEHVKTIADRIIKMRKDLYSRLTALGTPGDWNHIRTQTGMFSFTGLNPLQVERMIKTHHIYMLKQGRINMCGLTSSNIDYVAQAIDEVIKTVKS